MLEVPNPGFSQAPFSWWNMERGEGGGTCDLIGDSRAVFFFFIQTATALDTEIIEKY